MLAGDNLISLGTIITERRGQTEQISTGLFVMEDSNNYRFLKSIDSLREQTVPVKSLLPERFIRPRVRDNDAPRNVDFTVPDLTEFEVRDRLITTG